MNGNRKCPPVLITVPAGVHRDEEQKVRVAALKQLASWLKRAEIGHAAAKRGEQA